MTELLDRAIEEVRKLPASDQDEAAEMLLWTIETRSGVTPLDAEMRAAIGEGLEEARRGEFAPEADIAALCKRQGI